MRPSNVSTPISALLADTAVITVAYNAAGFIDAMIQALPLDELAALVVVDNADEPALATTVAPYRPRGVSMVVPGANLGFGRGNNLGVAHAPATRWLLFLNPDAVLRSIDLEALVSYAAAHPEAAIVGPRGYDRGVPITSAGEVATWRTELRHHGPPLVRNLFPERRLPAGHDNSGPVGYVEGCCMLVSRSAFETVGGFDDRFFLCYEESDLARRVRRAGYEVHLCAGASVQHRPGTSREVESVALAQAELLRSARRYIRKWDGPLHASVFCGLVASRLAARRVAGRLDGADYRRLRAALADKGVGSADA